MLNNFWKSMRVVLPPRWALGVLVFALFLTVLQEVALWSWVSWSLFDNFNEIPWPTQYSSVLPLGLFFYAIWRGIAFHLRHLLYYSRCRIFYHFWICLYPSCLLQHFPHIIIS